MARTSGPYDGEVDQFVGPGDEVIARISGLTGWSMNWWYLVGFANVLMFGLFAGLPVMRGTRLSFGPGVWACLVVGALLGVSFWTRPALVIAVTRQRQVLCRRIARPLPRKTFAQASLEAAQFTQVRHSWPYAELRYSGPGTDGKTVRLNVPPQYRDAVQKIIGVVSGQPGS